MWCLDDVLVHCGYQNLHGASAEFVCLTLHLKSFLVAGHQLIFYRIIISFVSCEAEPSSNWGRIMISTAVFQGVPACG